MGPLHSVTRRSLVILVKLFTCYLIPSLQHLLRTTKQALHLYFKEKYYLRKKLRLKEIKRIAQVICFFLLSKVARRKLFLQMLIKGDVKFLYSYDKCQLIQMMTTYGSQSWTSSFFSVSNIKKILTKALGSLQTTNQKQTSRNVRLLAITVPMAHLGGLGHYLENTSSATGLKWKKESSIPDHENHCGNKRLRAFRRR